MEDLKITGEVEDIIYRNKDNGYTVFSLTTEDDEVTCVGVVPQIHSGEALEIHGSWAMHPLYGRQVQVRYYEKSMPTTTAGMEKYLSSGMIKGIGAKTAKRIVERFGEATFYVIEEKPDLLTEIKGISYDKAQKISEVFCEQHELRRAMMFLQGYDISPAYAMKIYKKYKARTFEIVKNNPYRLADEVLGIGFKMADKMAAGAGIAADDPNRVKAAVKYVLNTAAANGDCYLPKERLIAQAVDLLQLHPLAIGVAGKQPAFAGKAERRGLRVFELLFLCRNVCCEAAVGAFRRLRCAEYGIYCNGDCKGGEGNGRGAGGGAACGGGRGIKLWRAYHHRRSGNGENHNHQHHFADSEKRGYGCGACGTDRARGEAHDRGDGHGGADDSPPSGHQLYRRG